MAKFEQRIHARPSELAKYLSDGIENSAVTTEMIDSSVTKLGDISVYLQVWEKYYMRNSSRAALTVQIVGEDNGDSVVTAISAGGGTGVFLNFSWGAESDFVSVVERLCAEFKSF